MKDWESWNETKKKHVQAFVKEDRVNRVHMHSCCNAGGLQMDHLAHSVDDLIVAICRNGVDRCWLMAESGRFRLKVQCRGSGWGQT